MPSLGLSLPLTPRPCLLPLVGDRPVHSRLAVLWNCSVLPLFCEWAGSIFSLGFLQVNFLPLSLAIPQFKLPSLVSSLRLLSGFSCPVLTLSNAACSSPFCPHLLVVDVSVWGTFLLGVAFRHVIHGFYLFLLLVMLPSEIQKLPPDPPVRGFPGVWKLPLLRLPSWDGSLSLTLLYLFLSFIFFPTSF